LVEGGRLHLRQIGQNARGGTYRLGLAVQPKAVQRRDAEVTLQRLSGGVLFHLPRFHLGDERGHGGHKPGQVALRRLPVDGDQLTRLQAAQLFAHAPFCLGCARRSQSSRGGRADLGSGEFTGRDVTVGDAGQRATTVEADRGQVVVALIIQHARFDDGALGHDSPHLAFDQALARLADLLRDRHTVPSFDQAGDVAVDAVVGHARQRHTLVVAHRATGQHHVADPGDDLGVVVECLVKVA